MRKLGLISSLWAALLFFPLTGHALGLGEIEVSSFLNQPLKATITVISARPGEVDDLLISLASRDAFKKAGLDRPAELSKLRFTVEKSEDGQSAIILVSTKAPVVEPFLSFLVEADWAKGRLLREFTVLLDPPSFAQQAAVVTPDPQPETPQQLIERKTSPVTPSAPATADTQQIYNPPIAMSGDDNSPRVETMSSASADNLSAEPVSPAQLVVGRGDTLWKIASDLKQRNQSMAQMMLALQEENPAAFGRNNINNLKVGAILRVPDSASVGRLSKQEARARVLDQNGLWDDYLARKSGSTTRGAPTRVADAAGTQKTQKSQLKLVAPGDGKSTTASLKKDATGTNDSQLRKQLALAEEELEAARLENNDLNSRVKILEQQLSKFEELQKLVQIQDNSLARLQKSVSDTKADTSPPTGKDMSVEGATQNLEPLLESAGMDTIPTEKMIKAAGEMLESDKEPDVEEASIVERGPSETVVTEAVTAEQAQPVQIRRQDDVIPAPVIVTEVSGPAMDGDIMDMLPSFGDLIKDPVILGGLGGVLALILGFLFLKRKKAGGSKSDEGITLEGPDSLLDDDVTPVHVPAALDDDTDVTDIDTDLEVDPTTEFKAVSVDAESEEDEDEFTRTAIIAPEEMPEVEETPSGDQDDVLNEVDVYLAYGLYDNAEDLLVESLENSPERADYRAKLLDTYFATKNKEAFIREATILRSQGKASRRFWDRVQVMGFELAPNHDLFSDAEGLEVPLDTLEYVRPSSADFDIGEGSDGSNQETDFDLSGGGTDAFDLSSTDITKVAEEEEEEAPTEQSDLINIDFPDLEEYEEENLLDSDELLELDEKQKDLNEKESNLEGHAEDEEDLDTLNFDDDMDSHLQSLDEQSLGEESLSFDLSDDGEEISGEEAEKAPSGEAQSGLITDEVPVGEEMQLEPTLGEFGIVEPAPLDDSSDLAKPDQDKTGELHSLATEEEDDAFSKTQIISSREGEGTPESDTAENADNEISLDEGLDFDMSDIDEDDLQPGSFSVSEAEALGETSAHENDITEFKPADYIDEFETDNAGNAEVSIDDGLEEIRIGENNEGMVVDEGTEVIDVGEGIDNIPVEESIEDFVLDEADEDIDDIDIDVALDDIVEDIQVDDGIQLEEVEVEDEEKPLDEPSVEVDDFDELAKTGTFAPGDFNEETLSEVESITDSDELGELDDIEDLMLPDDVDEVGTKLDLARAFMDMGDIEGARSSLEEVLSEGNDEQKAEATELMNQMNS